MLASTQLPQLLSRCTFWYSLLHSQHKYPGVKQKKLIGFGALYFLTPAGEGGLNFYHGVQLHPPVRVYCMTEYLDGRSAASFELLVDAAASPPDRRARAIHSRRDYQSGWVVLAS